jgi:transcriptional regulator MraZ
MMFRGSTPLSLDGKGRLAIPAKHRDTLMQRYEGRVVVTLDPGSCLSLYPFPEWDAIEQRLNSLSSFNPLFVKLKRILIGHASDLELDSAGRILLPALLREKARLEKEVMLVGQGNKFEIWNTADWEAKYGSPAEIPPTLDELFQKGELPDELKGFSL